MSYRVELAKSGRAACKHTQCKEKIDKGTLRFASITEIKDHLLTSWRHWGCVTATQLQNIKKKLTVDGEKTLEQAIDYLDGYDEVDSDSQEKIMKAIEQGYVDDEDWRHEAGGNREVGRKGRKKAEQSDSDENSSKPITQSKAKTKTTKAKSDADGDEAPQDTKKPAKKKAASKKLKMEDENKFQSTKELIEKKQSIKKSVKSEEVESGVMEKPVPNKRGRPAKKTAAETVGDAEEDKIVKDALVENKASGRTKKPVKAAILPTRVSGRKKANVGYKDASDDEGATNDSEKRVEGEEETAPVNTGTKRKLAMKKKDAKEESSGSPDIEDESEQEQPKKKRGRPAQKKMTVSSKKGSS